MPITLDGTAGITSPSLNATSKSSFDYGVTLNSSSNLNVGATLIGTDVGSIRAPGIIIQVVQKFKTDAFTTTSTSYVDVTGLSVTITPKSSTSKILVIVNVPGGRTGTGGDAFVRLMRDSTAIGNGTYGSFGTYAGQYGLDTKMSSRNFIDSPATTSPVTYKVQVLTSGDTIYIGTRRINDFTVGCDITVMEIAS